MGEEDGEGEGKVTAAARWNLAEYLPPLCEQLFQVIIGDFLLEPHDFMLKRQSSTMTPEQEESELLEWLDKLVSGRLSRRLFQMVRDIVSYSSGPSASAAGRSSGSSESTSTSFPQLPGSHLPLTNPALEFIKAVCHVFALDSRVEDAVRRVRANLLKLVEVKPFAPEAEWRNPALYFVLPDVICPFCNFARDVDLCRDPEFAEANWVCGHCQHHYDKPAIEGMLVDILIRKSAGYQVQDVVCQSCNGVKMANLPLYCSCSGRFACVSSTEDFRKTLLTFGNLAAYHKLPWLSDTVAFLSSHLPSAAAGPGAGAAAGRVAAGATAPRR